MRFPTGSRLVATGPALTPTLSQRERELSARGEGELSGLDRWAGWLGTSIALASLALVALADLGWFRTWSALTALVLAALVATFLWRPPVSPRALRGILPSQWARLGGDSGNLDERRARAQGLWTAALAVTILLVGTVLIAPGSENVVGPRDQSVYFATGFAIARWGSTTIHDPGLRLLAQTIEPDQINAWLYENPVNHARIRFPTQLFIQDLADGTVEGGFLPVLPVWIALAASLGGLETALHVSGAFGVLALAFAMLACRAAGAAPPPQPLPARGEGVAALSPQPLPARGEGVDPVSSDLPVAPYWALVGAILAVSFSQVWWAREPMAEALLGAFSWLVAWASVQWLGGGGWRWALLASLGAAAALLTRADGVLVAGALALILLLFSRPDRRVAVMVLAAGAVGAILHDILFAPIYIAMTYGAFTFSRAVGGLAALGAVTVGIIAWVWLRSWVRGARLGPMITRAAMWSWRAGLLALIVAGALATIGGVGPGVGRAANLGAPTPLAWLPAYVPWPFLLLAALGLVSVGWGRAPRAMAPLMLIGGLPALLYLPDPLVTGDHPWMVRRLVPAVIPLIAVLASLGARALWQLPHGGRSERLQVAGPLVTSVLLGLGLALAVAADINLLAPRHAAGAVEGVQALGLDLPPNAVVVFPSGPAGIHMAMPLAMEFGVDAFAITEPTLTAATARTLARMEAAGRAVYWAEPTERAPALPPGATAELLRRNRAHYQTADNGPLPPPLQLRAVEDQVALYRLRFGDHS